MDIEYVKREYRRIEALKTPLVMEIARLNAEKDALRKAWEQWQRDHKPVRKIATGASGKKSKVAVELTEADVRALAARFGLKVA